MTEGHSHLSTGTKNTQGYDEETENRKQAILQRIQRHKGKNKQKAKKAGTKESTKLRLNRKSNPRHIIMKP